MAFDTETLGQALVDQRLLTRAQLNTALEEMQRTSKPLEAALVALAFVNKDQIREAIASAFGMPFVSLSDLKIPEEILDLVSPSSAEVHRAIPYEKRADGSLLVAVADLENLSAIDDLRYRLNVDVTGALTTDEEVEQVLENYYRKKQESLDELLNDLKTLRPEEIAEEAEGTATAAQGPVVKLLELVLVQAIKDRASDIHFEPFEDNFKIRYRVDGALYELVPPPRHLAPAIASRIKVMAGLKIAELLDLPLLGRPLNLLDLSPDVPFSLIKKVLEKGDACFFEDQV